MCSTRNLLPTSALLLLLAACSSKGSSKDAGAYDVGGAYDGHLTVDTKLTVLDASRADAHDSGPPIDVAHLDVPIATDSSDVPRALDTKGSLDSPSGIDTPTTGDTRDATKLGDAVDIRLADAKDGAIALADAPLPNSCQNPVEIPMDDLYADVEVTTDGESHDFDLSCATGGNDVVLSFYLDRTEMVYADTFGAAWNTILAFASTCPLTEPAPVDGMVSCNDDACGTSQSQAFAILPHGRHYLVVSGANGESGNVTVHFQHAPVAAGINANLPEGSGTLTGTAQGYGQMGGLCEASGPEDGYWWISCPDYAGGTLSASTCTGTDPLFDTVLSLQISRTNSVTCANGDTCGQEESMTTTVPAGAGIHMLAVVGDGLSSKGNYTLTYSRP